MLLTVFGKMDDLRYYCFWNKIIADHIICMCCNENIYYILYNYYPEYHILRI